jgi:hypothetical protein
MEPMHMSNTPYIRGSSRVITHEMRQTTVGSAGKANVAACFTVLLGMGHRRVRRHPDQRQPLSKRYSLAQE